MNRLPVFKALGDNTRYAIYLELARSVVPLSTSEIAEALDLHPNTVRPHLERMRDIGLLEVEVEARGAVGRPQHRYSLAADAPSLGLEPPAFPLMANLMTAVAAALQATPAAGTETSAAVGRVQGRVAATDRAEGEPGDARRSRGPSCVQALTDELAGLGFDPATADDGATASIAFTHCPYRELAQAYPELVCHLHRGIVEGFVERWGGADVDHFATLVDRDPCHVELKVH